MMTSQELKDFELQVKEHYEAGRIKAPVHLSGGNEQQLIDIFKQIDQKDWVFSAWRSHYHALLHGISPDEVMRQILVGRSMTLSSADPPFLASAIAGGVLPIAVGAAWAIKRRVGDVRKIFVFVGDMTAEMGIFHECCKYAVNFDLPIVFIIEDNGLSVVTPTGEVWGRGDDTYWLWTIRRYSDQYHLRYKYNLEWPHHGTGTWVSF